MIRRHLFGTEKVFPQGTVDLIADFVILCDGGFFDSACDLQSGHGTSRAPRCRRNSEGSEE